MKNIFFNIFTITLFTNFCFFACEPAKKDDQNSDGKTSKTTEESTPIVDKTALLSFERKTFSKKGADCEGNCTRVKVNYPSFLGATSSKLNQKVDDQIRQQLSDFVLKGDQAQSLEQLSNTFIESFQEFQQAFPDASATWYVEIDVSVKYIHSAFVSLSIETNSFTGGAHTNSTTQLINLKPDGELIQDISFFIKDINTLRDIAEEIFRTKYSINKNQQLSDAGYSFENDQFALNNNFGFTYSGMVFYYNSYEIGPYVLGPSEIILPFKDIRQIYRFEELQS